MIYQNEKQLNEDLDYWKKILRLQDWEININIEREKNMLLEGTEGTCSWDISNKRAQIQILDSIDYDEDFIWKQDMEETLVHELLHLHYGTFENFERGTQENTMMEQSIVIISKALINLKRQRVN
jgi:hypothetical protein